MIFAFAMMAMLGLAVLAVTAVAGRYLSISAETRAFALAALGVGASWLIDLAAVAVVTGMFRVGRLAAACSSGVRRLRGSPGSCWGRAGRPARVADRAGDGTHAASFGQISAIRLCAQLAETSMQCCPRIPCGTSPSAGAWRRAPPGRRPRTVRPRPAGRGHAPAISRPQAAEPERGIGVDRRRDAAGGLLHRVPPPTAKSSARRDAWRWPPHAPGRTGTFPHRRPCERGRAAYGAAGRVPRRGTGGGQPQHSRPVA